jgi:hypothetical protein
MEKVTLIIAILTLIAAEQEADAEGVCGMSVNPFFFARNKKRPSVCLKAY